MRTNYLKSTHKQFEYYKYLGENVMEQLEESELMWQFSVESNSIQIIVNHLSGNMLSRWTDFLHSDGEKSWRERDQEFEPDHLSKEELLKKWNEGWNCLFIALENINIDNFDQEIFIRNQSHTIIEAINRQLSHYAYHIGQIVFIGKMIKGKKWKPLSIVKGKSEEFNKEKNSKGKHSGHFTDDIK